MTSAVNWLLIVSGVKVLGFAFERLWRTTRTPVPSWVSVTLLAWLLLGLLMAVAVHAVIAIALAGAATACTAAELVLDRQLRRKA